MCKILCELSPLGDGTIIFPATPVAVTGGLRFKQVSAGLQFTCGLTTDTRAYCWGVNEDGALGNGTKTGPEHCGTDVVGGIPCRTRAVAVVGGLYFTQLSAGDAHTCGKTSAGVLYCWGANGWYGTLGDGSGTNQLEPTRVADAM